MVQKAVLVLADGSFFEGEAFGYLGATSGEVCFNTSMTGYQEILTDPSYSGQIITMTYPEIGNYGINQEDIESSTIHASGFIVKNLCETPSNWRGQKSKHSDSSLITLNQYLSDNKIPGLKGIDTRKLVRLLRDKGAQMGILESGDYNLEEIISRVKKLQPMAGQDLANKVSTKESYTWNEKEHPINFNPLSTGSEEPLIVALDFGVKFNILRKCHQL